MKKLYLALLLTGSPALAAASGDFSGQPSHESPPGAYADCAGKKAGDEILHSIPAREKESNGALLSINYFRS